MLAIEIDGEFYTEEQYKKDLMRMFDAFRDETNKGTKDCKSVKCNECPIKCFCGNAFSDFGEDHFETFKKIKLVYNWAKEHPIVTNRDKLKEVFGINVINSIVVDCGKKESCYAYRFSNIKDKSIVLNPISQYDEAFGDWLDEEYKESKKND